MNIKIIINNNIWLVILLALLISFIYPFIGLKLAPFAGYFLMVLMFISCLDINIEQFKKLKGNFKRYLLILAIIHLQAPFIIFLCKPFLSPEIFLGLLLTAAMPSGMSVVFLSCLYSKNKQQGTLHKITSKIKSIFSSKNDVALPSLLITTTSNILSPIIVPLIAILFAQTIIKIDVISISVTIIKFAIIPVIIAKLISKTKLKPIIKKWGSETSIIMLFLIMLGIISPTRNVILENISISIYLSLFVMALIIIDFSAGYLLGRNREEKIMFGITSGFKNFTLASVVALSLFSPAVALPAIIYAVVNNFLLIPLQYFVKKV